MRYLFLVLLLAGCATSQPEKWELQTGEKIICQQYEQKPCGLSLKKCGDDKSVDYECLSAAVYHGPGDAFEPEIIDEPKSGTLPAVKSFLLPGTSPAVKTK